MHSELLNSYLLVLIMRSQLDLTIKLLLQLLDVYIPLWPVGWGRGKVGRGREPGEHIDNWMETMIKSIRGDGGNRSK